MSESISKEELIYWIDKWFVQERAKQIIGRELNEDEIVRATDYIEWGLCDSVFDVISVAIKETVKESEL